MTTLPAGHDGLQARLRLVTAAFVLCFAIVGVRLVALSLWPAPPPGPVVEDDSLDRLPRPDIVDRNGQVLATDVRIPSLFADPRRIIDVDEAVEQLIEHLPDLDRRELVAKLTSDRAFVWIRRELTPRQQAAIHNLGIPGLGFRNETKRVYPVGRTASHVVGYTDIDSRGLAGIERYLDNAGRLFTISLADPHSRSTRPVQLALDMRVQHAVYDELEAAMKRFDAIGAGGIVLDVNTGEIVAMVSLPDFDPNSRREALDKARMNRLTTGVFEMGSTFKTVTVAMALDYGVTTLNGTYDARAPIRVGGFSIGDFHAKNRVLTVPEVFIYSSNIGSAKMALDVGIERHQEFLRRLGLLDRLRTEIPESAMPIVPQNWSRVTTMTVGFGHGLSVTPLQLAVAGAAIVNGGRLIPPTFLRRDPDIARTIGDQVLKPETSRMMRDLLALNVEKGTARRAHVEGYSVGGKTGTAEKVVNGRYSSTAVLTSFLGMVPADQPRYLVLVMLDEPKPAEGTYGHRTSGWNAVPTGGRIIGRIAPLLDIPPVRDKVVGLELVANAAD